MKKENSYWIKANNKLNCDNHTKEQEELNSDNFVDKIKNITIYGKKIWLPQKHQDNQKNN